MVSPLQAWAVFKGKFKEGDKAEPATWKTRLRCALNKSPDFEEVTERSQLDISEPYKVYRIVPEGEQKSESGLCFDFQFKSQIFLHYLTASKQVDFLKKLVLTSLTDLDCSYSLCHNSES